MIKDRARAVVIDLEATCWNDQSRDFQKRNSEIIEIGVCELDFKSRQISKARSLLVVPTNFKISSFCEKLTSLSQELVEAQGTSLQEAIHILNTEYDLEHSILASYGGYDKNKIKSECAAKRIPVSFSETHLNVSHMASLKFGVNKKLGLSEALKRANLSFEGHHHRGVDDAVMIAKLLSFIL